MKGAKAAGKMAPTDLLGPGWPQTFHLFKKKKKKQYLQIAVKQGQLVHHIQLSTGLTAWPSGAELPSRGRSPHYHQRQLPSEWGDTVTSRA